MSRIIQRIGVGEKASDRRSGKAVRGEGNERRQPWPCTAESAFNGYWRVDGLRAQAYPAVLANPAKMRANIGLKHADARSDAELLARQQALGVRPEGYVYSQEARSVRDLRRRRMKLGGRAPANG